MALWHKVHIFLAVLIFFPPFLFSTPREEYYCRKIHACLILKDHMAALREVECGLRECPNSKKLLSEKIHIAALSGNENLMLTTWKQLLHFFPTSIDDEDILEEMAWGIIFQGYRSSSPVTRVMALIAAFFANDSRGVYLLESGLNDYNSQIRNAAVQLSSRMKDELLCKKMQTMIKEEKVWSVRIEVIKALGMMKIDTSKSLLRKIIENKHASPEEVSAAIQSSVNLVENVSREEIITLINSERSAVRVLACELASQYLDRKGIEKEDLYIDCISQLVNDYSLDVRRAALKFFGVVKNKTDIIRNLAKKMVVDSDIKTAILATWLLTLQDPNEGQQNFSKWLLHKDQDIRLFASGTLAACGKYGLPLMRQVLRSTEDPYVRINIAIGLIGQRTDCKMACDILYQTLLSQKERLLWEEENGFRYIVPSRLQYRDDTPQYPESMDQLVRLEMIQILAFLKYEQAQNAMKMFLKNRITGISGMTAALLLTEGDEEALDLARTLLHDEDMAVRVHAALILSVWGRDESVISLLKELYTQSDRELKERILEGIGFIGAKSSIPFLVDCLHEPYANLRIIAASSLLQALNH